MTASGSAPAPTATPLEKRNQGFKKLSEVVQEAHKWEKAATGGEYQFSENRYEGSAVAKAFASLKSADKTAPLSEDNTVVNDVIDKLSAQTKEKTLQLFSNKQNTVENPTNWQTMWNDEFTANFDDAIAKLTALSKKAPPIEETLAEKLNAEKEEKVANIVSTTPVEDAAKKAAINTEVYSAEHKAEVKAEIEATINARKTEIDKKITEIKKIRDEEYAKELTTWAKVVRDRDAFTAYSLAKWNELNKEGKYKNKLWYRMEDKAGTDAKLAIDEAYTESVKPGRYTSPFSDLIIDVTEAKDGGVTVSASPAAQWWNFGRVYDEIFDFCAVAKGMKTVKLLYVNEEQVDLGDVKKLIKKAGEKHLCIDVGQDDPENPIQKVLRKKNKEYQEKFMELVEKTNEASRAYIATSEPKKDAWPAEEKVLKDNLAELSAHGPDRVDNASRDAFKAEIQSELDKKLQVDEKKELLNEKKVELDARLAKLEEAEKAVAGQNKILTDNLGKHPTEQIEHLSERYQAIAPLHDEIEPELTDVKIRLEVVKELDTYRSGIDVKASEDRVQQLELKQAADKTALEANDKELKGLSARLKHTT